MWWVIGIVLCIVFVVSIYSLIRAGAREDEMFERLLVRLHEEMEKRGQDESPEEKNTETAVDP